MQATFERACVTLRDLPNSALAEIAVAGRSNCGKSTLINALTRHASLARTSSTPGRTREIIFFQVKLDKGSPIYLVDLPGYGYAKAPGATKARWADILPQYVHERAQLKALLVLNDVRRRPGPEERVLLEWCAQRRLPLLFVLTKADKLAKNKRQLSARRFVEALTLEPGDDTSTTKQLSQWPKSAGPVVVSATADINIVQLRDRVLEFVF